MQQKKGYRLIEESDLSAAMTWANGLKATDGNQETARQAEALRAIIKTGLSYAIVMAHEMGGLPCFDDGQTPEQRRAAMAAAAKLARRPGGRKA